MKVGCMGIVSGPKDQGKYKEEAKKVLHAVSLRTHFRRAKRQAKILDELGSFAKNGARSMPKANVGYNRKIPEKQGNWRKTRFFSAQ
ncbi:hypothetical protein GCM10011507_24570 [Edaphobacter acidisoli]|uniref:Uncharacterized protein n=1 Tax=Edaphobacter acidisoli TaxID=2040573 RepID=A0A916RW47_9BACT|nr:hypothetical protein GCM10011507_24570 [Edaphobacter acidisoli]